MREITGKERDALILSILKRIDEDTQVIGAPERTQAWEDGWRENLEAFRANPCMESLVPKFVRPGQPVRIRQAFYQPDDPYHELKYIREVIHAFLLPHLRNCDWIAEFGCGTGYNLFALAPALPYTSMAGYDFSPSAVKLVDIAANHFKRNTIIAGQFNMLEPSGDFIRDIGAFTFGAIEQLASRFEPFIEWLIEQRPRVVCHVEPIVEFMDENNLVDWLGAKFHRKRGYTVGLLPYLKNHPKIEVLHAERSWFGSVMFESYGRIVWRPR